jgi:dihydrofolate reductase
VTHDRSFEAPEAIVVHSLDEAFARAETAPEIAIIGGADIYVAALPRAIRIYLTEVHRDFTGDAQFEFDRAAWREAAREDHETADGLRYSFVTLERRV